MRIAAIEAGGTKFVCGLGSAEGGSLETARIDTRDPDKTLAEATGFFRDAAARHGAIDALGIASFGPVDLDPASPAYGHITTTPKPGWQNVDLLGRLRSALGVPAAIDTDVNAAALAEARMGAGQGARTLAYVTVGTGIGVGVALDGAIRHAGGHAEAGHLSLRRHPDHPYAGGCPYHGDCLEGLANGPAIKAAWGASLDELPADHPAWAVQADYLGQLCAVLVLTVAPDRIVLGGGVMTQTRLFPAIRERTGHWLGGYVARYAGADARAALIVPPGCAEAPGLVGAYLIGAAGISR
ncbi:ROK family protein [Sphingomonas naphthae]|uniref:fructokinase n=1 Tax=Sphingomonas naphthae TaxID=1813468 RepID=A0ABY7TQL4_9SPHN|nr:ROK family protein [Sphingomonas naphthae]WCT74966.1 ROK family protein [Sphingomonas naphthae]